MQNLNFHDRMQPTEGQGQKRRAYDYGLEGIRGLAALWVGYSHAFNFQYLLDPSYHPTNKYLSYLHAAHGAVLIFFMLSGYVIGLTNRAKFSKEKAIQYLMRRGIRLLPIYFIAVLFSIIVLPGDSLAKILGNLFFLQSLVVPVLSSNTILWTLNYEVVYYLVFLLVWYLQPKVSHLLLGSLAISSLGWFIPSFPQFLSNYASGWIFWLIGLWLSWKVEPSERQSTKVPLLSYLLLLAATNHLATGKVILNGIGFSNSTAGIINFSDLALLPIGVLIISTTTGRQFKGVSWLRLLCFALPLMNIVFLLVMGRLFENPSWIMSAIYTIVAIIVVGFKTKPSVLAVFAYLGSISYAFYILHMPVMHWLHSYFPFSGSVWSFSVRLLVWFLITVGASSLLELVMQPKIKHWFNQRFLTKTS